MVIFCSQCGKELPLGARFCSACGAPVVFAPPVGPGMAAASSRLVRPRAGRVIAGVCQGLALAYGWEITWVRVIAVLAAVFSSGAGGVAYLIFWIVMPDEPLLLAPAPRPYVTPPPPSAPSTPPPVTPSGTLHEDAPPFTPSDPLA